MFFDDIQTIQSNQDEKRTKNFNREENPIQKKKEKEGEKKRKKIKNEQINKKKKNSI